MYCREDAQDYRIIPLVMVDLLIVFSMCHFIGFVQCVVSLV